MGKAQGLLESGERVELVQSLRGEGEETPRFLAVAKSPASLADPLRNLAKSNDAFADSMAKLDEETEAVANYSEAVHKVALDEAARAHILDKMGNALKQGMPDASAYDEAETNALNAA